MNIISSNGTLLINNLGDCQYDLLINPSLLQFSLYKENTPTLELLGVGTLNSKLKGNIKLSNNPSNLITVDSSGLLVLPQSFVNTDQFVKVSSNDTTATFLENKLETGSNLTITKINSGANEKLRFEYTGSTQFQLTTANSTTVNLFGNGTIGNTLYGQVKISSTVGNILSIDSNGLYVPPTVVSTLNPIDTNSIDMIISGNDISSNIRIDNTVSNAITVGINGLRVIPFSTPSISTTNTFSIDFTGTSGMSLTANVKINNLITNAISISSDGLAVKINPALNNSITTSVDGLFSQIYTLPTATSSSLGGIKVGNGLSIASDLLSVNPIDLTTGVIGILPITNGGTGSSSKVWVDLTTAQTVDGVKTFIGSSLKVSNLLQVNSTDTSSSASVVNTTLSNALSAISTKSMSNASLIDNGLYGQTTISNSSNFIHTALRNVTGNTGALYFNNTGNILLYNDSRTAYSGLNGTIYGGNTGNVTGDFINAISSNAYFSSTGNYDNVVGIKLSNPSLTPSESSYTGTITNYYGMYIPDINTSDIIGRITNKYGIYQAGTTAQNYFGGATTFASGGFDSDMRYKTLIENAPIIKNIGSLKSKSYIKDEEFHIGYFAQEVQQIIPSAVIVKNDGYLSVAYHEVHTAKIEYLENRLQELENLLRVNNLI